MKYTPAFKGLSLALCAVYAVFLAPTVGKRGRQALVATVAGVGKAAEAAQQTQVLVAEALSDWTAEVAYRHRQTRGGRAAPVPSSVGLTEDACDAYAGDNKQVDARAVSK